MANSKKRLGWLVPTAIILCVIIIAVPCYSTTNTRHIVGGDDEWTPNADFEKWLAKSSFRVGDTLVFKYSPEHNVVEVGQLGYLDCSGENPIGVHAEGVTIIHLTEPGTRFFICTLYGRCVMQIAVPVDA